MVVLPLSLSLKVSQMNVAYLCDRGLSCEENEDSILVDEIEKLFLIADGMGGHQKGAVASTIVVDAFRNVSDFLEEERLESFDEKGVKKALEKYLNHEVSQATEKLFVYAQENVIEDVIGSTVVGLYKLPIFKKWVLFHLGDSRVYHLSNQRLTQLTVDHMSSSSSSSVLSKAIGNFAEISLEIDYVEPQLGDIFFLCSDGISDYCRNDELLALLLKYRSSLALFSHYVKELVYKRGAKDNLSLVVLVVGEA